MTVFYLNMLGNDENKILPMVVYVFKAIRILCFDDIMTILHAMSITFRFATFQWRHFPVSSFLVPLFSVSSLTSFPIFLNANCNLILWAS